MRLSRSVFIAYWVVAAAACSSDDNGTRPPPGPDPTNYAAISAVADVVAFAGPGSTLESMVLSGVREDGTIDLTASYPSHASYTLTAPASSPTGLPVGGGGFTGPGHRRVTVDVRKPDVGRLERRSDGGERVYTDRGMNKREDSPEAGAVVARALPACTPQQLWQAARQRGAPAGAVASIAWDGAAYRFSIVGAAVTVLFDASCTAQ